MISIVEGAYVWQCAFQRYSELLYSVTIEIGCEVVSGLSWVLQISVKLEGTEMLINLKAQ